MKGGSLMNIYTIGHSVHSQEAFIHMLQTENIQVLVDVRAFPASRKFPHFSKERMQKWLPQAGIEYVHLLSLAGRRNKSQLRSEERRVGKESRSRREM